MSRPAIRTALLGLTAGLVLATSACGAAQVTGDLAVTADFGSQGVSGKAIAPFTITEFSMPLPHVSRVLSLNDGGTLEFDFQNLQVAPATA